MDNRTLNNFRNLHGNSLAIAGLNFCDSIKNDFHRAELELSWRLSDPAIVPLLTFVLAYREFYDQCLEFAERPNMLNREILQRCYQKLNSAHQFFL